MRAILILCCPLLLLTALENVAFAKIKWPAGTYGIPRAQSGCPSSNGFTWRTGWRFQDTPDILPSNARSSNFHLDATVDQNNLKRSFCMKTVTAGDAWRPDWPKGKYCIYKKGSCPKGLKTGYITWDDEDWFNKNTKGGVLPDGVYDKNTKLFYCCSTEGNKAEPIELPTSKPFFLVAFESAACQQVKWAQASSEWIRFDTEEDEDGYGGAYPYGAGLNDHTIHYCYYTSCNYTLTTSSGSFQSPNYPNSYPAGQYCSWRIKVPEGLQVVLSFPKFSLQNGKNTDNVQLYDGQNENSPTLGVYSGDMTPPPSGVRSSSNELFVIFKTDSKSNFAGFQASYSAQRPTQPPTTVKTTTKISTVKASTTPVQTTRKPSTSESKTTTEPDITTATNQVSTSEIVTAQTTQVTTTSQRTTSKAQTTQAETTIRSTTWSAKTTQATTMKSTTKKAQTTQAATTMKITTKKAQTTQAETTHKSSTRKPHTTQKVTTMKSSTNEGQTTEATTSAITENAQTTQEIIAPTSVTEITEGTESTTAEFTTKKVELETTTVSTPNTHTEEKGVTTGSKTTDEPPRTHTSQTTVYTKRTTTTVDEGSSLSPGTQATNEPTHTRPTEYRSSTFAPPGNESLLEYRKMEESGSSSVALILVPVLCFLLLAVCVLMLFLYRRRNRKKKEDREQFVYFERNPKMESVDNPMYDSGVKFECDSNENPLHKPGSVYAVNPLYSAKHQLTDAEPSTRHEPVMRLDLVESHDLREYENPIYDFTTSSPDESSA